MTDNFVTAYGAVDGAIPVPESEDWIEAKPKGCDEVTLTVTLLVRNDERVVARFDLDSPYWIDSHDMANGTWSLALPRYEMMHLLCTLRVSPFMKVIVKREELLNDVT